MMIAFTEMTVIKKSGKAEKRKSGKAEKRKSKRGDYLRLKKSHLN